MVTQKALAHISKILPHRLSVKNMFRHYQKIYSVNNKIRSEYNVEIPILVWMRRLLERLMGEQPTSRLVSECVGIVVERRAANAVAFTDAHSTLRQVSKREIRLGVISNVSSHEVATGILEQVGLERFFDILVTSASTGTRKPDPGIFWNAVHQLDIGPEEAVIVGDSERHDIRGGKSAGLQTILINRRVSIADSEADYSFTSLAEASKTLQSL